MAQKQSPSIVPRFTGKVGRRNLLASICSQQAVAGNAALARRLIAAGSAQDFPSGRTITSQGDADNDLYMIISGSVDIIINGRAMAIRSAGVHVGEMALLDPTSRRSATVRTKERTIVLKVSEPKITTIARDYPDFWRRLALELATRLRERTKFIRQPNPISTVFIGSSSPALDEAEHIQHNLHRHGIQCRLWTQNVFRLSHTTVEELIRMSKECDFAVLLLTPDDMTTSNSRKSPSPRDNVVFELGLFMGALGCERTYLVVAKGTQLKLPTDLLGVTYAPYTRGARKTLSRRLRQVLKLLRHRIRILGTI